MGISDLMEEHHTKVGDMLGKEDLQSFKWELQKHFLLEEKAIFFNVGNGEFSESVQKLLGEHKKMLDKLNEIEVGSGDLEEFKQMLLRHKEFEDKEFYPLLDRTLTDEVKGEIVTRIQDELR